jgi:cytochrome c oxidase cbb3-type subunit 3
MAAFYDRQAAELTALGEVTDSTLDTVRQNPAMLATGEKVFAARCTSCHGFFGEGNIGPNLTDELWIHGGRLTQIYHTIMEGVPEKGMVSWKTQLPPADLLAVAAYVSTLQGTNPPNAKAPQGTHVDPAAMVVAENEADEDATRDAGAATDDGAGAEVGDEPASDR